MADDEVTVLNQTEGAGTSNVDTKSMVGVAGKTVHRQVVCLGDETTFGQVANVSAAGALQVDGSAVTQPVSAASLPLPTGASTLAEQQTQTTTLQLIDDTVHTTNAALGKATAIAGQLDDTTPTDATENNVAPVRITTKRAIHSNLRNDAGTEVGTSGAPIRVDPTGTTTQPVSGTVTANAGTGNFNAIGTKTNNNAAPGATNIGALGGVASASAPTHTEGNLVALSTDLSGNTRIAGTVTANAGTGTFNTDVKSNCTATGALGAAEAVVTINCQGAGTTHWEIDTGTLVGTVVFEATLDDTNYFAINAIRINGTIIASTTTFADRGSMTSVGYSQVRLRVSAYTSGTSNARLESSTGANVVRVGQALPPGTNSIGIVDTELPAAAALGDTDTNPTTPIVGSAMLILDNATTQFQRVRKIVNNTSGIGVIASGIMGQFDDTTPQSVTENNYSPVRISPERSLYSEIRDAAGNERGVNVNATNELNVSAAVTTLPALVAGTANIGDVDVLTLPSIPTGANTIGAVTGTVAHDAADSGNPQKIGFKANSAEPASISAVNDRVDAWGDEKGRLVVMPFHPKPDGPATLTLTSTTATDIVAAPGVSLQIVVTLLVMSNTSAIGVRCDIRDGTTVKFSVFLAASGGGAVIPISPGWRIASNTALTAQLGAAVTDVRITAQYYTEATIL